ncbi:uncharacterized protein LOC111284472 [Durio zibethinus]|uniref:Uncharacterized protein LOC111284472 n=1 Tax=Durio zibethinus TaxID=66656 RepID=A0A6P5XL41_DURZI|nr:uncharacterized protein LOC111284472 [Durio zibethinus]
MARWFLERENSTFSLRRGREIWKVKKVGTEDDEAPTFKSSSNPNEEMPTPRKKLPARSVVTFFRHDCSNLHFGLGLRVVSTLFGYRRGHVHFAFQKDPNSPPAFLIDLAIPINIKLHK